MNIPATLNSAVTQLCKRADVLRFRAEQTATIRPEEAVFHSWHGRDTFRGHEQRMLGHISTDGPTLLVLFMADDGGRCAGLPVDASLVTKGRSVARLVRAAHCFSHFHGEGPVLAIFHCTGPSTTSSVAHDPISTTTTWIVFAGYAGSVS